ncbi:hypothetical protein [Tunturibacter empetritectus]|uniref:Uncharacterized protein n=1 Tax=Tunturiibacter empetritectus TaxID=3069691 RepID=A0A7W8MPC4_9BACT|nr:hypothetical protein [Edaphobacter lichenicola]MBB5315536.1 hypothetical protein [Edaphobacter lichenicola]
MKEQTTTNANTKYRDSSPSTTLRVKITAVSGNEVNANNPEGPGMFAFQRRQIGAENPDLLGGRESDQQS